MFVAVVLLAFQSFAAAPAAPTLADSPTKINEPALAPCAASEQPKNACKIKWRNMLLQSVAFNAFQNVGNSYTGYWFRYETTHGKWFHRYAGSVTGFRYSRWSDDDPFLDDYVGHPMMGSITNYIFLNNDPAENYFPFENTSRYWKGRLKAYAFSAAYSAQWKIGPFGEAGVGFTGDHLAYTQRGVTNGTGMVDFIITPTVGLGWTIVEDYVDKKLVTRLEQSPHNPVYLTFISFLTPTHGWATLLALKAPWTRTDRHVLSTLGVREAAIPEGTPRPRELGMWAGGSWIPGKLWGSARDDYGTFNVRYSRLLKQNDTVALRYAGDGNGSVISEPTQNASAQDRFHQRRRVYGFGASPAGLQLNFRPRAKVQPFVDAHGGAVYFLSKLSGPEGTTVNLSFDTAVGMQVLKRDHRSVTVGYRYQHFSPTNFSGNAPGIDNNVIFVGLSMFR